MKLRAPLVNPLIQPISLNTCPMSRTWLDCRGTSASEPISLSLQTRVLVLPGPVFLGRTVSPKWTTLRSVSFSGALRALAQRTRLLEEARHAGH